MRAFVVPVLLLSMLAPRLASADATDLLQTIRDLRAQARDKARLDSAGAARIELNEVDGWLGDATNAAQEDKEELARRIFDRVRTQLALVDQLVELARLERKVSASRDRLEALRDANGDAKRRLADANARIRAHKIKKGEE